MSRDMGLRDTSWHLVLPGTEHPFLQTMSQRVDSPVTSWASMWLSRGGASAPAQTLSTAAERSAGTWSPSRGHLQGSPSPIGKSGHKSALLSFVGHQGQVPCSGSWLRPCRTCSVLRAGRLSIPQSADEETAFRGPGAPHSHPGPQPGEPTSSRHCAHTHKLGKCGKGAEEGCQVGAGRGP